MSDQLSLFDAAAQENHLREESSAPDTDRDARAFAQNPENNVVLEASAGTGKTSVLVARYVNLLTRGVDPANILAITFTRKAAAEMRDRIIRDLRRAAEQSMLDRRVWLGLRDRLADVQISTIDAFCLSLLREFPLEADIDPGFTLADETEIPRLVEQSLDKALAIFIGLAKREPDLALVLAQLGLSRTRDGLAHLLERRLVAWDVLDRFLACGPADLTSEAICARVVRNLIDLFAPLQGGVETFLDQGPVGKPGYHLLAHDLRRLERFLTADNAAVRGLLSRLSAHFLTASGKRRVSEKIYPYVTDDYPNAVAGKRHRSTALALSEPVEQIIRAFGRDLNVVLARGIRRMFSIALDQYRNALDERSVLDFSDVLERAVDLLKRMDEFSQSRFRLEGRYHHVLVDEFQDTSRKQWELVSLLVQSWGEGLGVAGTPSIFVVGDRKQSIYRFRDADVSVLEEAGLFIEGLRPGQTARRSIARSFRAVPELLSFVNEVFSEIGRDPRRADDPSTLREPQSRPEPGRGTKSSGSSRPSTSSGRPEVPEGRARSRNDFTYDIADRFPIDAVVPDPRGPALGIAVAEDPAVCARVVANEVSRLLLEDTVRDRQTGIARKVRPGDVAILFRSRASHREFERELEALGIPTYVYKGLGFFDADEIKDTSALIRFLANPASELRAAAFLRSRFVRLSDEALAQLAPSFADALVDPKSPDCLNRLAEDDRHALERARVHVPCWIARVDRVPPADLIEAILPETAYSYELRGPRRVQAWENLKKMRGLIRRIQNRGYATLGRIADHLDALTAGDESNAVLEALDAVNLMTVHAAKGLEFPIVFIVNLAKGASGPPKPVRVSGEDVSIGPFVSETDEEEKARELEETKRLLYVAMTRARDRLYLASALKDGRLAPGRGSLGEVLPESIRGLFAHAASVFEGMDRIAWTADSGRVFEFRRCAAEASPARVAAEPSAEAVPPPIDFLDEVRADEDSTLAPRRMSVSERIRGDSDAGAETDGQDDPLIGTLVHRLFQFAANLPVEPTPVEIAEFAATLLRPDDRATARDLTALTRRAVDVWQSMRNRSDIDGFLGEGDCLYEVPFSMSAPDESGCIVRGSIDCLVRHPDGSLIVIEFKTGRRRAEHQAQLDLYLAAVRGMFASSAVRGLLVYPPE
jgi:ATP-dependent helicase/nuclease subunit A